MKKTILTIKKFRNSYTNSDFEELFVKSLKNEDLDDNENLFLLKTAIYMLNFGDLSIQKLGYKLVVDYCLRTKDFIPLYDVAINKDYIPVSKLIEKNHLNKEEIESHFFKLFFSAYHDNFYKNDLYISAGQRTLIEFSKSEKDYVLVAPTSYGKSEIIINKVLNSSHNKTCIIVPTKALLSQTKRRILEKINVSSAQKLITHPEMFKGDESKFIAILTQERLLKLLQENEELQIDNVLVDEAHNIFGGDKKDNRAILLAQIIMILKKRNHNIIVNYFSPFIDSANSINLLNFTEELDLQNTDEFIKVEKYYVCDLTTDRELKIYNQFSNDFINENKNYDSEIQLIQNRMADKNIIYFNRPKNVESFISELISKTEETYYFDEIENALKDFIHPEYKLVRALKKGLVYHHGGMPEVVRLFVEEAFKNKSEIKHIVTTSTLLEGVNIPAEKIFLLSVKKGRSKLSKSQFRNLIGRVNRFSEIFNSVNGNLELLEPEIYVIKGSTFGNNIEPELFLEQRAKVDLKIKDIINNILLKDVDNLDDEENEQLNNALEYLENIEPETTELHDFNYATTIIGKLCYKNNVHDFDIKENEQVIDTNLTAYKENFSEKIHTTESLLLAIFLIFIQNVEISEDSFKRLQHKKARNFYKMFFDWRIESTPYKLMIGSFLNYWNTLPTAEANYLYVGQKWGETKREDTDFLNSYVNLSEKSQNEKVNLAILKIKEEQDFVEFSLFKYIDILYELNLVDEDLYEGVKYCTTNKETITLLKNGMSLELAQILLKDEYSSLIEIDITNDEVFIKQDITQKMTRLNENPILTFEVQFHTIKIDT